MRFIIKKAILPAAGLGTRFLPATKASPKEMLPIVDKPQIQYAVEEAMECGIEEFIIITGKNKRAIEDHFDSSYRLEEKLKTSGKEKVLEEINRLNEINIAYIRQRVPLGLGHAILCAKPFVKDEPFAVILSDDVIEPGCSVLSDMMSIYEEVECPIVALEEVHESDVDRYGIVDGFYENGLFKITDMVEKPKREEAPSKLAIIGRYILTPEIFKFLERQTKGSGGEIQLTDALKGLLKMRTIFGYPIKCKRYDAGDKLGYLKATVDFALKNKELSDDFKRFLVERVKSLS